MSRLSQEAIQAVRDAIDIVSVASEHTHLKKRGRRWQGLCPLHKEKTPSFSVDPDRGLFYCFGCGAGGDAIGLHMQVTGDDFIGAVESLAHRYGIALATTSTRQDDTAQGIQEALDLALRFFRHHLERNLKASTYLDRRQIPAEFRKTFELGYAPDDWHALEHALGRRIPIEALLDAGLVGRSEKSGRTYDRFRDRLMFPIRNGVGRLVGFGGRTLGDDRAKYVNTAETSAFHKGRLLYGLHYAKRAMRDSGRTLLVEGYLDVIAAVICGIDASVAGMGTALTNEQVKQLARYSDEVVLGYDGDNAGEQAVAKSLPLLLDAGLTVRRAAFPAGHDPDSLRLSAGEDAVRALVDDAPDALWATIRQHLPAPGAPPDPQDRKRRAEKIIELLRPLRDDLLKGSYTRRAAEELGIPENALASRLGPRATLYQPTPTVNESTRTDVSTQEEHILRSILRAIEDETPDALPPPAVLPPPEAFFDSACRNIYRPFLAYYRREDRLPTIAWLRSELDPADRGLDKLAQLLIEEPVHDEENLVYALTTLLRRWHKQRLPELMRQIRQAQQDGDNDRLTALLDEKAALTRNIHPDATGTLW